ncbi:hypothetical protein N7499_011425 [Penicillium canescens]|uniref:PXA domain-containing protein n=1 Tax=Penicillium canescens TaxID=5083 RepID=A0AAD6IK40_PENCN|nr:uncharacterized protein N7446_006678 [Penicillium canescens]KAJ5990878.1 hypothetical protein N7522_011085 [Penicillium canescens]KAJ6049995.1 hypothetical protein N7444_006711 [Penicillium canescens]KAJ6052038.1 hypothetical protein N7460_002572 [Penicillium canescens]KAJ6062558.1 hypothetical protein N7446_006678 [Penicillium canescens]KAJ6069538.1 hypothetical protein N7499_011425 [Penicillium canescens]
MSRLSDDVGNSKLDVAPSTDAIPAKLDTSEHISNTASTKELVNFALNFLSTSSNETLLGVFALLILVTYVVLGRIGLVLIGIVLGVVLHASWDGPDSVSEGSRAPNRRRELALEVSSRLLDWPKRDGASLAQGDNDGSMSVPEDLSPADLDYATFQPATASALKTLTDAVIRDYVQYWYEPILPSESTFPGTCRRILTHFVTSVSLHLSRKRTEDTFLQFLTNSSSIVIVFLNELAAAFAAGDSYPMEAQKTVDRYLEQFPDSSLANVLSQKQQHKKLNMIADDILSNFLDSKAYDCPAVRDFLREIFAGVILESTVTSLARPEFINDWIIYLLQDGESEIMHAIDAGVEGARNQGARSPKCSDALPPEAILNPISQTHQRQSMQADRATEEAVLEAKRLSAMIASQDIRSPEPTRETVGSFSSTESDLNATHNIENNQDQGETLTDPLLRSQPPANPEMSESTPHSPRSSAQENESVPLILHGAQVLVDDDGSRNEKGQIKSRPTWDYLLQVEPASTRSTGWMVFRKYADFQSLHEMLETVSRLNRIQSFSDRYPVLPSWKGKTRQTLARDLEGYLHDAMKHEALAETDRMRRFLEKDAGSSEADSKKPGFSFPSQAAFENMGKGMLGALTNAPKGMAGGGKAVFDGVTGVFGGAANNKRPIATAEIQFQHRSNLSLSEANDEIPAPIAPSRTSLSKVRPSFGDATRTSENNDSAGSPALSLFSNDSLEIQNSEASKSPSANSAASGVDLRANEQDAWAPESTLAPSENRKSLDPTNDHPDINSKEDLDQTSSHRRSETEQSNPRPAKPRNQGNPITADETQIAVELIFAVINELYTLSSAWNIRRTLLNAARSYILRPGSPTLETIRTLLQDSMIKGHTSDEALGNYIAKLRENALPTETELKAWPSPPSEEEKARLRDTARRLFVQRGIPQALTSVMGAAASREALEKIFDSLQVESVARGFVFSVLLQGLRVLTL